MSEEIEHGTRSTYVKHGCRCGRCRRANTKFFRAYRLRQSFVATEDSTIPHGVIHTYQGYGCRCEPCVEAGRAYRASLVADFKAGKIEREHGNFVTYDHYGCRCEPCREAGREYRRTLKMRHRVADKLNP